MNTPASKRAKRGTSNNPYSRENNSPEALRLKLYRALHALRRLSGGIEAAAAVARDDIKQTADDLGVAEQFDKALRLATLAALSVETLNRQIDHVFRLAGKLHWPDARP